MSALIVTLLVAGASLLVIEAHVASYGVIGVAGVIALAAGLLLAIDAAGGGALLAMALVLPVAAALLGVLAVAARKSLAVHRRRALGGADGLVGRVGVVRRAVAPDGQVLVQGELWRARRSAVEDGDGAQVLDEGDRVVIDHVHGLTVSVRRAEEWELL